MKIQTYSGELVDITDIRLDQIHIEDIAHALANQCRFAGHCSRHYSIAEHSLRVAHLVGRSGGTEQERLWGLLHDASEAYLVDVPTPIKHHPAMREYRAIEREVQRRICFRFGLPEEQPALVATADKIMLGTEARDLMQGDKHPERWPNIRTAHRIPQDWYADAKGFFLEMFHELTRDQ